MKKTLVASILGLVAAVGSVHGQGSIFFDNYGAVPYYPVRYNTVGAIPGGAIAGAAVGGTFKAKLFYGLGSVANFASLTDSGVVVDINPGLLGGGYFQGPIVSINGYVSGPVTFAIQAWDNSRGSSWGASDVRNLVPQLWQEPSVAGTGLPAGNFTALPGPINVNLVPEPSALALLGLGASGLLIFRRRQ